MNYNHDERFDCILLVRNKQINYECAKFISEKW